MPQELEAVFDGTALQLEVPLNLAAGTRVRIVVENVLPNEVKPPKTFLKTAQSLKLRGNPIGRRKLTNICMGKLFPTMTEVFLDTSFAIALSSVTDQNHVRAVQLANQIETNKTRLVTTQAILLEIGNALSKQRHRAAAIQLLESLETDPSVEVVLLTNSLYKLAFNLFKQREDKEWGLVDCISFIVMQDRGITDALTADTHFQQAGFRALLRD